MGKTSLETRLFHPNSCILIQAGIALVSLCPKISNLNLTSRHATLGFMDYKLENKTLQYAARVFGHASVFRFNQTALVALIPADI